MVKDMKKVLIKINDNAIVFQERKRINNEYKNIINTNVISANELIFSNEYIENNQKMVSTFLNELASTYDIDTIVVENSYFLSLILNVIKNINKLTTLIIKDDVPLTFKICEELVKTSIKNVNCYALQPFMIEYLDKYNIIVESRNEILFLSNFMLENDLSKFSSLYYKVTLQIKLPMSNQDEEDFQAFASINKYLKTINVNKVNKNDLEYMVSVLRKNNKKNVKIVIYDNITDLDTINYLRDYNKKKSKKYKIYFRLDYSKDYLNQNIIKQTNSNLLIGCGLVIILIITFSFGYVFYDNYTSMQKVTNIQDKLSQVIDDATTSDLANDTTQDDNPIISNNDTKVVNGDVEAISKMVNPETVAWITVNNTNINYPVVQSVNNEYYLKHNIYLENDNNGWVFMDYRNNLDYLSDNIIIYAHNRYYSGIMFGTLQNTQRKNWYTDPDNQIITLRTMNKTLHYKVFSIYKISVTTDYIQTLFTSDTSRLEFYNMLKDRSIYDFGIEFDGSEKIITLSTCAADNHRNVLHAVLVDE
jgi:sortase B